MSPLYIKRAEVRCAKQRETSEMTATNDQESEDEISPSRKLLRSSMLKTVNSRSQIILKPVCIICNQEKAYFTDVASVFLTPSAELFLHMLPQTIWKL